MIDLKRLSGRMGINLKPTHIDDFLSSRFSPLSWVEVHTENYMVLDTDDALSGAHHKMLDAIKEKAAISLHGIGMSLGGVDPLSKSHLKKTKQLVDHYKPALVSEHIAWCQDGAMFHNDLLPVPYTDEALHLLVDHINEMQDHLGRQILVENPSTYLAFKDTQYDEADFIMKVVDQANCGLLLDLNNILVSCHNQGWDVARYLGQLDFDKVGEIHVAGHSDRVLHNGATIKIDDHGSNVRDDVWQILDDVIKKSGPKPVLLERDNDVPSYQDMITEAHIGQKILDAYTSPQQEEKAS